MTETERAEDQPLGSLLARAVSALRSEMIANALKPTGLTFPEYICMRVISQSPGKSNAELARHFGVSPQAMIRVLAGLQRRGLVARPAAVVSRRALPAHVTQEGLGVLKLTDSGVRAAEGRVLANLTEDQQRDLRRLLSALGQCPPRRVKLKPS